MDIIYSSTWLHIHDNKLRTPIIVFFIKCSHYSTGKVDGYKCDLSGNYVIYGKSLCTHLLTVPYMLFWFEFPVGIQTILVNCTFSVRKEFMQLSNICNYQYFPLLV